MKDIERKPDITYIKNSEHNVSTVESKEAAETTRNYISAELSAPKNVTMPGGILVFTLCIDNISNEDILQLEIFDKLSDSHMKYLENSAMLYADNCTPRAIEARSREGGVELLIDSELVSGKRMYIYFATKVDEENLPSSLYNYVVITDKNTGAQIISNSVKINSEYGRITVEKTMTKDCRENALIYVYKLENVGNVACRNVVLKDVFPLGFGITEVYYNTTMLAEDTGYTYIANELTANIPSAIDRSEISTIIVKGINR